MHKPILFLGFGIEETSLIASLQRQGRTVVHSSEKIAWSNEFDLVISFGYRHIISKGQIDCSIAPIINLHISYLPWNKGAHPNFWSHFDCTPSGVTIHEVDAGIDTGNIIYQKYVNFEKWEDTFALTYKRLLVEIEALFNQNIDPILSKNWESRPQRRNGNTHRAKDLPASFGGWNSNIQKEISRLDDISSANQED